MKLKACLAVLLPAWIMAGATDYVLSSPDGKLSADISVDKTITYSVSLDGKKIMGPGEVAMSLVGGKTVGRDAKVKSAVKKSVDEMLASPFYRANEVRDNYNELTLTLNDGWKLVWRVYDDGVAYRWVSTSKKPFEVEGEISEFVFEPEAVATVPYVKGRVSDLNSFQPQFFNSFENSYTVAPVSALDTRRLSFLPLSVDRGDGVRVCITETALENYPGMYLNSSVDGKFIGVFAPYPRKMHQGGHNELQLLVDETEPFIAKVSGARSFPWRVAVVARNDAQLAATNLSYLLAEPSRVADLSWIKPGKVAWDWWNAWNIDGVDFEAGINTDTYKAYIDFAASKGIEYVILDEGWAVNKKADLMQVVPEIDLKEIVDYAASRGVDIILWAGYLAFDRDMENVCKHYADMGVKGFKVDFMDRDDQLINDFNYRAAETAARHKLLLDLHGTAKPAGLNRTYPNVLNFEGVNGLEQMKWAPDTLDQVTYDVMIPFLRQVAGPMDYTQGAMRNAIKKNYRPVYTEPMSQGTRCRQLALYMVLDSPVNMLCDTPSAYEREAECADFIAEVPTVWDETRILDAAMGDYIVTARRKGNVWYVGGLTDWDPRDFEFDLSFLNPDTAYEATIFADGKNAHRAARDYFRSSQQVKAGEKMKIHAAPGGGFAVKIAPAQ